MQNLQETHHHDNEPISKSHCERTELGPSLILLVTKDNALQPGGLLLERRQTAAAANPAKIQIIWNIHTKIVKIDLNINRDSSAGVVTGLLVGLVRGDIRTHTGSNSMVIGVSSLRRKRPERESDTHLTSCLF